MMEPTISQIRYGSNDPLPEQIPLRAGALSTFFEDGTLRHIKLGDKIILHQIYAAVRDHNWGTVPAQLTNLTIDASDDSFVITYVSHHQQDDIDFVLHGRITGEPDSTICFEFEGQANSTFLRNRIGFCVLHPTNCAGQPCKIDHVDGSVTEGHFPKFISSHQPFFDMRAITHHVNGIGVRVLMVGDTFEMEDQRNWTDASYKTYCTPLGLPFPVNVNAGDIIQQRITLSLQGDVESITHKSTSAIRIEVGEDISGIRSPIGLCLPESVPPLTDLQVQRLSALNLNHLRLDLHLARGDWQETLNQAIEQASQLDCRLEVAVHLSEDADTQLQALKQFNHDNRLLVARWIIFHESEKSTSAKWIELARQYLSGAPIGAGTDAFFTELNRERPPLDVIDFATYSTNPQVHAFDNLSLVETLAIQADTVESARVFCDDKPIVVSPITLKMRFNPNATGEDPPVPEGELPPQVDEREMSLFGACWTLGSLKYHLERQVESVTYYETVGWRGVMEHADAPRLPDKFPSIANAVFPMYHVFADLGEIKEADVVASQSTDNLVVESLVMRVHDKLTLLLANMSPTSQMVQLDIPQGQYRIRRLNQDNAIRAMTQPESYRNETQEILDMDIISPGLTLEPYEYVRLQQV